MARILSFVLGILFWGGRGLEEVSLPVKLIINFINPCGSESYGFEHPHVVGVLPKFFDIEFKVEFRVISGHRFSQASFVFSFLLAEEGFKILYRVLSEVEFLFEAKSLNLGLEGVEAARATRGMQSFDDQKIGPVSLDPSGDDSQRLFQLLLGPSPFEDLNSPVFKLISLEHRHSQIPCSGIDCQDRFDIGYHVFGLNN